MTRQLLVGLFLAALFWQCASGPSTGEEAPFSIGVKCEPHSDLETGEEVNDVFLLVSDQKVKIGEVNICKVYSPDNYATFHIPDSALVACGAEEEILFVIREENTLKVFQHGKAEVVFEMKLKS